MQVGEMLAGSDQNGGLGMKILRVGTGKQVNWPGFPSDLTVGTVLESQAFGFQFYITPTDEWMIDPPSGRTFGFYDRLFGVK